MCVTVAGTPVAKAAPKKRRGGKHRNKGTSATEGTAEGGAADGRHAEAAVQSSSDVVSDSLANLQLERLNSNGAAGQLRFVAVMLWQVMFHKLAYFGHALNAAGLSPALRHFCNLHCLAAKLLAWLDW